MSDQLADANARSELRQPRLQLHGFIQASQLLAHEFFKPRVDSLDGPLTHNRRHLRPLGSYLLRGSPLDDSPNQAASTRIDAIRKALRVRSNSRRSRIKP